MAKLKALELIRLVFLMYSTISKALLILKWLHAIKRFLFLEILTTEKWSIDVMNIP